MQKNAVITPVLSLPADIYVCTKACLHVYMYKEKCGVTIASYVAKKAIIDNNCLLGSLLIEKLPKLESLT